MGMIGSLVGADSGNSGGAGLNYSADAAKLILPVNEDQQKDTYGRTLEALNNQAAFIQATAAQNGLSNQANVYNQLQNYASGQGPNPALAQLQLATGQNTNNQAALMAGQRGAGANPALIARLAAQQGGANQQNAAGQAAALQAQQSAGALNQLAGLSTQQVQQQANAINNYTQGAQNAQSNILGAIGQYNNAQVGSTSSQNSSNAGVSQIAAKGQQDLLGGILKGGASAFAAAHGGEVPRMASGGYPTIQAPDMNTAGAVSAQPQAPIAQPAAGAQSKVGKFLSGASDQFGNQQGTSQKSGSFEAGEGLGKGLGAGLKSLFGSSPSSPEVDPYLSSGDAMMNAMQTPESDTAAMDMYQSMGVMKADGGEIQNMLPMLMKLAPLLAMQGAEVPGKASVKGDSLKNDKVPAILSPKEIVLPRSVTMAPDAPERAAEFVRRIQAGQHKKKKK